MAARNVLRNRFRTILTILGVAVSILAFVSLRTLIYSWTVFAEVAPKDRLVTRNKISFVMDLPKRYLSKIAEVPGITSSTYANWFGGRHPQHPKEFFASLASDTDTIFSVYNEMKVEPDALQAWKEDRQGAIVGDVLAKQFDWKVGDRVNLESGIYFTPPDDPWTFTIRGIYQATARSVDRSTFIFHWKYLNERVPQAMKDQVGWFISRVKDPQHTADIAKEVDRRFEDAEIQTLSQDERTFNASFLASMDAILKAIDIVSIVILVIMMLILGNTIAMGVRERTNEYGALRALGYSAGHLSLFVLVESMTAGLLGGLLGVGLSYPIVERGIGRWLEENMGAFFPFFRINTSIAGVAMLLALILAGVAALVPAWRVARLNVVDALRRVE